MLAQLAMDEAQIRELLEVLTMAYAVNELIDDALRRGLAGEAKGEARGEARGEAKGKAEGALEGYRDGLRALVRVRFEIVPDALEQRIATASRAMLDDLYTRAATVDALDTL